MIIDSSLFIGDRLYIFEIQDLYKIHMSPSKMTFGNVYTYRCLSFLNWNSIQGKF